MSLRRYAWTYSPLTPRAAIYVPEILLEWHRARKMGVWISALILDGKAVDAVAVERLNLWLSAGGAWNASLLPYFEAERVLGGILRQGGGIGVGPGPGGRWPSGTRAEEILGDRREGV